MFAFYAKNREHVEMKAEEIPDLCAFKRLDLKEYPWVIEGDTVS